MRLLECNDDGEFSLTKDLHGDDIPEHYAILSHTWGEEEVTYNDLIDGIGKSKAGYEKIRFCGQQARNDNLRYFWVDTCCIDKSNSTELSEAINSMFRWYRKATKCYVYLSDISTSKRKAGNESSEFSWEPSFRASRWFTRGWTLQELLAPNSVEFFARDGTRLGDKKILEQQIQGITGIPLPALQGAPLSQFGVEERLSWVENRETKRNEDLVYSLLGIFDIHMPLIYGEGRDHALTRLRDEIEKPSLRLYSSFSQKTLLEVDQRQGLMDSLRFDQIDARQATIKTAHAKTCKWLLKQSEYLDWLDDTKISAHRGFLWIKGKPATGKSTIMKFAYANSQKTLTDAVIISFFFNARGEHLEKSTIGMYRSLLFQLLEKLPELHDRLSDLLGSGAPFDTWNYEAIKDLFRGAVENLGHRRLICFIDALDECEEDQVREMVGFLESLAKTAVSSHFQFRICFSSRHYPTITVEKGVQLVLEGQEGHKQDVANYLHSELKAGNSTLVSEIKEEILDRANGIFLWVVLVVQMLNKEFNRGRIHALRKRLEEIPNGLEELFHDILTRDNQNLEELILCLQWILYAKRPLKSEELYFAVLAGEAPQTVTAWNHDDVTKQDMERFVLNSSKGLAETTKAKAQTVQFIHESVREFFLKENGLSRLQSHLGNNFPGLSHERLRQCCQNYLEIDTSEYLPNSLSLPVASSKGAKDLRQLASEKFPFLEYATRHILYHADTASRLGVSQNSFVENFSLQSCINLENFSLLDWINLNNLFERHQVRRYTTSACPLYVLVEQNLPNLIHIARRQVPRIDIVGRERHGSPLHAALAKKNENALRTLLAPAIIKQSNRDVDLGRAPMLQNHDEIISFLFDNSDDILGKKTQSILGWAVEQKHEALIKLLINTGKVDINSKVTKGGQTLLAWAAARAPLAIVKLLLETGKVDVNSKGDGGRTPLSWAAVWGKEEVVKLLLKTNKVDVNSKDGAGNTALLLAATHGHRVIVELLLPIDKIVVDPANAVGSTPLSWATRNGHIDIVKLLLSTNKVNVNFKDKSSKTPLSWATEMGHKDIADLLIGQSVKMKQEPILID